MSGGSYEYLFIKDATDLLRGNEHLQPMADRLAALGYMDAAKETNDLIVELRIVEARLEARVDRLRDVWKAVEWLDSMDSGPEAVAEAVAQYRGERP